MSSSSSSAARAQDVVAFLARLNSTLLDETLDKLVHGGGSPKPLSSVTRDFPLAPAHLANGSLAYDGPPLFCLSDSVEACRLMRDRFAARAAPITVRAAAASTAPSRRRASLTSRGDSTHTHAHASRGGSTYTHSRITR